jgi:SAM-dependent methyltransferase
VTETMPRQLAYEDYCWDPAGAFRQKDLTPAVEYDAAYLDRMARRGVLKAHALAAARLNVLEAFVPEARSMLDFGCGIGQFVNLARTCGWDARGHDVAPGDEPWRVDYAAAAAVPWQVVTFFDSLNHLTAPDRVVRSLSPGWVMVSVPECHSPASRDWFMSWEHRRPGEHLWHWNRPMLDQWFWLLGYEPVMHSHFEDDLRGRYHPDLPNILTAIYRQVPGLADVRTHFREARRAA